MTVTASNIIPAKFAENVQTQQYISTGVVTIIDKFTATNTSGGAIIISVNLVARVGTASNANAITYNRSIASNETYTFPELVGHILPDSGFISTIANVAGALTIRASGRVIT